MEGPADTSGRAAPMQQQGPPGAAHPAKLAPLQPGKYAFAGSKATQVSGLTRLLCSWCDQLLAPKLNRMHCKRPVRHACFYNIAAQGSGGIMAVHGRKPGMQVQPPPSTCALLASSVPATPQSPCNASPSRLQILRKKSSGVPEGIAVAAMQAVHGACGTGRGSSMEQGCERAASVLQLPELHALSTHCSTEAAGKASHEEQPQLRRSQRRRACTKQS